MKTMVITSLVVSTLALVIACITLYMWSKTPDENTISGTLKNLSKLQELHIGENTISGTVKDCFTPIDSATLDSLLKENKKQFESLK